jgi:AcrR family transcriptional regulator
MVQQERAQITRDNLVEGAALAFYRLGYGMATTAAIVESAGTTRGALYFHFQSKEEIARAVIAEEHSRAMTAGLRIQALNRPAFETMILLCVDLAERLMTDPVVMAGIRLTTEITNFNPPLRAPYEDWERTFADMAEAAVSEGDFKADVDPEVFARFIIPAYTGIQLVSDTFTGRKDLLQRLREMWTFVFPGVVPADRLDGARLLLDRLLPAREAAPLPVRP